jgi:hypothetical protein
MVRKTPGRSRSPQDAHGGVGKGGDSFGVKVIGEDGGDELVQTVAVEWMGAHEVAA